MTTDADIFTPAFVAQLRALDDPRLAGIDDHADEGAPRRTTEAERRAVVGALADLLVDDMLKERRR